jgi:hypothetical protein
VGAHRSIPDRLTFREFLRYRRFLGSLVRADRRAGRPLTPDRIAVAKDAARAAVRACRG